MYVYVCSKSIYNNKIVGIADLSSLATQYLTIQGVYTFGWWYNVYKFGKGGFVRMASFFITITDKAQQMGCCLLALNRLIAAIKPLEASSVSYCRKPHTVC